MERLMGLVFDPKKPFALITGDASEGRYFQGGIVFGADGLPFYLDPSMTDDAVDTPLNPELATTDDAVDTPPPERRKKS